MVASARHPNVLRIARFLTRLAAAGVRGLLDDACLRGPCFEEHVKTMAAPLKVPAVSIFSRADGIVPWQLCQDPYAECVEVHSTHTGMGFDPQVYEVLGPRLAAWVRRRAGSDACGATEPDVVVTGERVS